MFSGMALGIATDTGNEVPTLLLDQLKPGHFKAGISDNYGFAMCRQHVFKQLNKALMFFWFFLSIQRIHLFVQS